MSLSVSIIIPTYNSAAYLDNALKSIQQQTLLDYEVIVVDAGSDDGTKDICLSYDERFKFHELINSKQGEARNKGIDLAKGKYLLFLDSDDVFADEGILKKIISYSAITDADFYNFSVSFLENGHELKCIRVPNYTLVCRNKILRNALRGIHVHTIPWNKLYKRSFLIDNSIYFPNLKEQEDMVFALECAMMAREVSFKNETIVHSTVRSNSLSRSMTSNNVKCCLDVFIAIKNLLTREGIYDLHKREYGYYLMRTSSYILLMTVSRVQEKKDFYRCIEIIQSLRPYAPDRMLTMFFHLKFTTCCSIILTRFGFILRFLRLFRNLKIIKGY